PGRRRHQTPLGGQPGLPKQFFPGAEECAVFEAFEGGMVEGARATKEHGDLLSRTRPATVDPSGCRNYSVAFCRLLRMNLRDPGEGGGVGSTGVVFRLRKPDTIAGGSPSSFRTTILRYHTFFGQAALADCRRSAMSPSPTQLALEQALAENP